MLFLFTLLYVLNHFSHIHANCLQNRADNFYTAAVVEYSPFGNLEVDSPQKIISENLANYNGFIKEASTQAQVSWRNILIGPQREFSSYGADIIVFPEDGMTTIDMPRNRLENKAFFQDVPSPQSPSAKNVCQSEEISSEVLKNLSCAALENQIYVVVNLVSIEYCNGQNDSRCPSDGFYLFNTDVVFDRSGNIVARYRKFNLYDEPHTNITPEPEHVFFDTDFGARFGVITCFDIVFGDPAVHLVRDYNITDIVFPTAWFQELPFFTGLQMQAGWSYKANVNLLAAGYNRPNMSNSGSGIHGGVNGAYTLINTDKFTRKLLISKVAKKNTVNDLCSEELKDLNLPSPKYEDENSISHRALDMPLLQELLTEHETALLSPDQTNVTLCQCGLCCILNFHMLPAESPDSTAYFRFVAFSGQRYFNENTRDKTYQTCAVVRCNDDTVESCGLPPNEASVPVFESLQISGNFSVNFVLPTSVTVDLTVVPVDSFTYQERTNDDSVESILQTTKSVDSFLTLGMIGFDFTKTLC